MRLARVIIPGTTGGLYTLWLGALGFLTVLVVFVHGYWTGRDLPGVTGEVLIASVGLMGVHTVRGAAADRWNAQNGVVPVPAPDGPPVQPNLGPGGTA